MRGLIESKDLSAVSKGLDMSWKLYGSYAAEKVQVSVDYPQLQVDLHAVCERMKEAGYLPKPIIDVSPAGGRLTVHPVDAYFLKSVKCRP